MTFQEMETDPAKLRRWVGDTEADYLYTAGVAGTKFLEALKKGKLIGGRCNDCSVTYAPPRQYCLDCFHEITTWPDLGGRGTLETFTVVGEGEHAMVWGVVRIPGTRGGFVHRIQTDPAKLRPGIAVEVVLRERRVGSINDILAWKPTTERR